MNHNMDKSYVEKVARDAIAHLKKSGQRLTALSFRSALASIGAPFKSERMVCTTLGFTRWYDLADYLDPRLSGPVPIPKSEKPVSVSLSESTEANAPFEIDPHEAWTKMVDRYKRKVDEIELSEFREMTIKTDRPIGLVFLGDIHFGSSSTDYERLAWISEQLNRSDIDLRAASIGDVLDNMVWNNVKNVARDSECQVSEEAAAARGWLESIVKPGKLVAVVAGNHDLVTAKMAGTDPLAAVMGDLSKKVPYAPLQMVLNLTVGEVTYQILLRHYCPGQSQWSPAQGAVKFHRWDSHDSDIVVAGHTHRSGFQKLFVKGRLRYAINCGAFKRGDLDEYPKELGLPNENLDPDFTVILWPNEKKMQVMETETAIDYLRGLEALRTLSESTGSPARKSVGKIANSISSPTKTGRRSTVSAKASRTSRSGRTRKTARQGRRSTGSRTR